MDFDCAIQARIIGFRPIRTILGVVKAGGQVRIVGRSIMVIPTKPFPNLAAEMSFAIASRASEND